ncbi:hypothetical protein DERP_009021 [Dermatophagoides pteronyssinus]|uniref:Uncharacterized protein n=1 Tax=Dermatophagoides pteronyssinus TaxID=6956 RepID=A0ABQ8JG94_DERPT|nr:hypothetical protein DERP_009021 [Dermatophagoides pteronyssinus]
MDKNIFCIGFVIIGNIGNGNTSIEYGDPVNFGKKLTINPPGATVNVASNEIIFAAGVTLTSTVTAVGTSLPFSSLICGINSPEPADRASTIKCVVLPAFLVSTVNSVGCAITTPFGFNPGPVAVTNSGLKSVFGTIIGQYGDLADPSPLSLHSIFAYDGPSTENPNVPVSPLVSTDHMQQLYYRLMDQLELQMDFEKFLDHQMKLQQYIFLLLMVYNHNYNIVHLTSLPSGPITLIFGVPGPAPSVVTRKSAISFTRTPVGCKPRPNARTFLGSHGGATLVLNGLCGTVCLPTCGPFGFKPGPSHLTLAGSPGLPLTSTSNGDFGTSVPEYLTITLCFPSIFGVCFPFGSSRNTCTSPSPALNVSTVKFVLAPFVTPVFCIPGNCDKNVIIDNSSTFGLIISSGVTNGATPRNSSAVFIAFCTFFNDSFGFHLSQSGHKPGAHASTNAPSAIPLFQSVVKLLIGTSGTLFCIQANKRCLDKTSTNAIKRIPSLKSVVISAICLLTVRRCSFAHRHLQLNLLSYDLHLHPVYLYEKNDLTLTNN